MLETALKGYIAIERRKAIKEGREEGRLAGLQEGRHRAKLEDARRMLAKGLDIALIEEITGLPRMEIEALR
jgi:predicted transposase/invertase (TIGR01784 family)